MTERAAADAEIHEIRGILLRLEPIVGRLDERLKVVEAGVGRLDERLRKIEIDVAELKGRVSQLPTTMNMFTYMGGLLALAAAMFFGAAAWIRGMGHP